MMTGKSIVGILVLTLSVVCLAAAISGVGGIWFYADDAAGDVLDAALSPVEACLNRLDEHISRLDSELEVARRTLAETAANLADDEAPDSTSRDRARAEQLKAALAPDVARIERTVSAIRQEAQAIGIMSGILTRISLTSLPKLDLDELTLASARAILLTEPGLRLDDVQAADIRAAVIMQGLTATEADLDALLADIQAYSAEFRTRIADLEITAANLRSGIEHKMNLLFIGMSLVLVWFAASQIVMVQCGLRLLAGRTAALH